MARPTITWRAALFSTANSGSPYSAAPTWTPAANSLIVAFCGPCLASASPDPTSVSAHGVSLTKVAAGIAQGTITVSVWVGDAGASPTSAAAAATVSGSPTGCVIEEFEVTNWNTGLGGAIGAILQINSGTGTATSGTTAVRLVAQTVNESAYVSCYNHLTNESSTGQGGNWTSTAGAISAGFNAPATGSIASHNNTGYTATATASWTTSSAYVGLVIEIAGTTEVSPSESLKIADTVTARLNPDPINPGNENVKVTDTVAAGIDLFQPTRPVTDAFTGTGALSGSWTTMVGNGARTSDVFQGSGGGGAALNCAFRNEPFTDDQYAQVVVSSGNYSGAAIRCSGTGGSGQGYAFLHGTASTGIYKIVGGSPTTLLKACDVATGHTAKITALGSLLSVYDNGVFVDSVSDTSYTSGAPGPATFGVTATLDDFEGGGLFLESLKIADTLTPPVLVGGDLAPPTLTENLKLADGGVATQQGIVQLLGVVHVQDQLTPPVMDAPPSGDLGPPTISVEAVKVVDTVTPARGLTAPVADEPLKLADTVLVDLPLQPGLLLEGLRLSDQPPFIEERLRITDSVTAAIGGADLTPPTLTESVKVQDSVSAFENPLRTALADEGLHCVDTLTPPVLVSAGDLTPPLLTETLKLADGGAAAQRGIVQLLGVVHVVDQLTPPVLVSGLNRQIVPDEVIYVQDGPPLAEKSDKYVSLTETLYLDDSGLVAVIGIDEILHVVDILTPPVLVGGGNLGPPTITVESLKVQDTLTVVENPLIAAPSVESLKVQDQLTPPSMGNLGPPTIAVEGLSIVDTVTVSENPLFAAPVVESLKVQDSLTPPSLGDLGPPTITVESIKIADTVTVSENPLFAAPAVEVLIVQDSVSLSENPLFAAPAVESLKVQDTVTASTGGLFAAGFDENLKVQDSVTVSENPLFSAAALESLIVQDSAAVFENPLQTSTPAEALKVQDQTVSASLGGLAVQISPDEFLHIQDTLLASMGGLVTNVSEAVRVQDALVDQFLNPEQTSITVEALKLADTVSAGLEISTSTPAESLKVSDAVTAAVGVSATPVGENLKLSDTVSASLTVLPVVVTSEALKLADSLSLGVDLLSVNVGSESLKIQDRWLVDGGDSRRVIVKVKSRR